LQPFTGRPATTGTSISLRDATSLLPQRPLVCGTDAHAGAKPFHIGRVARHRSQNRMAAVVACALSSAATVCRCVATLLPEIRRLRLRSTFPTNWHVGICTAPVTMVLDASFGCRMTKFHASHSNWRSLLEISATRTRVGGKI
jgi:hypothetical protein